jgi:hypothetical protein
MMDDEKPDTRPLKERILDYIQKTDYVSFAELNHRFGGDFTGGEMALELKRNLIIWANLTETACASVRELLTEHAIIAAPTGLLVYATDGIMLKFPIAKRERDYKEIHWLPVTLRPANKGRAATKGKAA